MIFCCVVAWLFSGTWCTRLGTIFWCCWPWAMPGMPRLCPKWPGMFISTPMPVTACCLVLARSFKCMTIANFGQYFCRIHWLFHPTTTEITESVIWYLRYLWYVMNFCDNFFLQFTNNTISLHCVPVDHLVFIPQLIFNWIFCIHDINSASLQDIIVPLMVQMRCHTPPKCLWNTRYIHDPHRSWEMRL